MCVCALPPPHSATAAQIYMPHVQAVATAFVVAWALRLGGFLVMRVWKTGHDSRFDEVKHQPGRFWVFWTLQVRADACLHHVHASWHFLHAHILKFRVHVQLL